METGYDRLDWSSAFEDGPLDPGADLPVASSLPINFDSSLDLRVTGSLTGTGSYTYDDDFDAGTSNVTIDNVMLTV